MTDQICEFISTVLSLIGYADFCILLNKGQKFCGKNVLQHRSFFWVLECFQYDAKVIILLTLQAKN